MPWSLVQCFLSNHTWINTVSIHMTKDINPSSLVVQVHLLKSPKNEDWVWFPSVDWNEFAGLKRCYSDLSVRLPAVRFVYIFWPIYALFKEILDSVESMWATINKLITMFWLLGNIACFTKAVTERLREWIGKWILTATCSNVALLIYVLLKAQFLF